MLSVSAEVGILEKKDRERIALYRAGFSDAEIAVRCGITRDAVRIWRQKQGLPANGGKERGPVVFTGGVHYKKVLSPAEAERMALFLSFVVYAAGVAMKNGLRPDVMAFITAWGRGLGDEFLLLG